MCAVHLIKNSVIPSNKRFLVDTNILFYLHSGITDPNFIINAAKIEVYSSFISKLITNNNIICTTTANIQEIFNLIEKYEYQVFCLNNFINEHEYTRKSFRKNKSQREKISQNLSRLYEEIKGVYEIIEVNMKDSFNQKMVLNYTKHCYDPIDYIIVEQCINLNITNFITHDTDFHNDSRLSVYSA